MRNSWLGTLARLGALGMVLGLPACGSSSGDSAGDAGAGGTSGGDGSTSGGGSAGGGADAAPISEVPYTGDIPALPDTATVDPQTYFPVVDGAVWRYRKRSATPQAPEAVTQGGESTVTVGPVADHPDRDQVVRRTVTIFDLPASGEEPAKKIQQVLGETFIVTRAAGQVGPMVKFAQLDIEEREVDTGRFVRTLKRVYDPPYKLIDDAWRVGVINANIVEHPHVTETRQLLGEETPSEQSFIVDVRVTAQSTEEALVMEGRYREHCRQVDVFDDVSQTPTRTFWLQPANGIVQWTNRDTNNLTFTLTETNLEAPAPPSTP